jgi:predicted outer membrane protein
MVADHTKANDDLKKAAAKAGIAVPSNLSPHHEMMLAALKDARDFDAAYIDGQLKAHAEAVELFTAAAKQRETPGPPRLRRQDAADAQGAPRARQKARRRRDEVAIAGGRGLGRTGGDLRGLPKGKAKEPAARSPVPAGPPTGP